MIITAGQIATIPIRIKTANVIVSTMARAALLRHIRDDQMCIATRDLHAYILYLGQFCQLHVYTCTQESCKHMPQ